MKRAHLHSDYKSALPFAPPEGITLTQCGERSEVFITGTQPADSCGGSGGTQVASWEEPSAPGAETQPGEPAAPRRAARVARAEPQSIPVPAPATAAQPAAKEKKGLFDRFRAIFR
jgi:hypothetical protein